MAYNYRITIGNNEYVPIGLIDSGVKVVWDKSDTGIMFKKQLSGSFILTRRNNEELYDLIMSADFTHCAKGFIWVLDDSWENPPIVVSIFTKRNIEYRPDKCQIEIKPKYYDPYGIDAELERDYNIINENLSINTITYNSSYSFEYKECSATAVLLAIEVGGIWVTEDLTGDLPFTMIYCDGTLVVPTTDTIQNDGWTFLSQRNTYNSIDPVSGTILYDITTVWFREVKYVPKAVDPLHENIPPQGDSQYSFEFSDEVIIAGNTYNKYVRNVDEIVGVNNYVSQNDRSWSLSSYFGMNQIRTLTRARKLIEILHHFATALGCTLQSEFFTNNVNPISYFDLSNLMIEQMTDTIFVEGEEQSDPATSGIITFKRLMDQLYAMFQVLWVIKDDVLYIEHVMFFRYNFSYLPNTEVGIDLTTYYPICLDGTYQYSYDEDIPIRVKYSFLDAWNLDFIGDDIDYSECLDSGKTETIDADLIITDIDPVYIDDMARDGDGFVMFHCDSNNAVISSRGEISNLIIQNAHLSWANLHLYYWTQNSPLPTGRFNGVDINFPSPLRKLRKQRAIEFPFCIENFDSVINNPIRTTMGDGEVLTAEYNFKTGNIKIELIYE